MAVLIGNFMPDFRDTLPRVALLYHSAVKLGLDGGGLLAKASTLAVTPQATRILHDFPLRSASDRSLGMYLYEETGAGISFAYRKLGEEAPF